MSVIEAVPDSDMPPKEREPAPSSGRLRRIARTLLINAAQLGIVGLAATFLMFVLLRTIPGDPARTVSGPGGSVSPEQIARIRSELGLDKPVVVQYFDWLSAAARGDLGKSLVLNDSVTTLLSDRIVVTLQLGMYALAFALLVAVPLSVLASRFTSDRANRSVRLVGTLGIAVPSFWLALLLIIAFQNVLPTFGYSSLSDGIGAHFQHMILPTIALGVGMSTLLFETTRASLIGTLNSDYVRTARSFGIPERRVYSRYALRNALLPTVTIAGLEMGALMGGALLVENAFAVPGMGRLLVQSVLARDYTVVQGCILVLVIVVVSVNLLMDVVYSLIDPRVRTDND
ncbi:ABC transporter permease [Rhodococcus erythropolis]|uniref:ABC transporter permease n=1 Tax=Rhodococcus erythropolis TaxID=1833 RepID=A0AAX3ZYB7_RHOER|nr:ABC transporter permease [Rhodococcus erythropolis]MCD2153811.1 ABC transporter permease [Rhodococcus cerastii]MCQ4124494.1 ABC transporter permease [Rhodococcus erythropolis]WMN02067.1 ABC transporter permease [Rhodococcus erythropolis]